MVQTQIFIASTQRNISSVTETEESNFTNIPTWEAKLSYADESVTIGDAVEIKRKNDVDAGLVSIFKGILEYDKPSMANSGQREKIVGGRHVSVKLWRKWNERNVNERDDEKKYKIGFWSDYYPHKIVEFLLHPTRSPKPKDIGDETYTRIGWGIHSKDATYPWIVTASTTAPDHDPAHVCDRFPGEGWLSNANQLNSWIKVDLRHLVTVSGIRIECRNRDKYARGYKIETSSDDITYTQVASKTTNKARNIVESWTPVSCRYIKITATANVAFQWFIGEIFIYESSGEISGISVGTLNEYLPWNCSEITANQLATDNYVYVRHGWKYQIGDGIIVFNGLGSETPHEGNIYKVSNIVANKITLDNQIGFAIDIANSPWLTNMGRSMALDMDYMRRTEAIDKVVKLCIAANNKEWEWWIDNDGKVYIAEERGTDVSGSVSFAYASNIMQSRHDSDKRQQVDSVLVLPRVKDDITQDRESSGWVGTGDYELVVIDDEVEKQEGSYSKAVALLKKAEEKTDVIDIDVSDNNVATGTWKVGDKVNIIDSATGISGNYRIKKATRTWNENGEKVSIEASSTDYTIAEIIHSIKKHSDAIRQYNPPSDTSLDYTTQKTGYVYFFEAEDLTWTPDTYTSKTVDSAASGGAYIIRASDGVAGYVIKGPGFTLHPGKYRAYFVLKVSSNVSSSTICVIDVYSKTKGSSIGSLTIAASDFTTSNTWQTFNFHTDTDVKYTDIEMRVNFYGTIADLSIDSAGIVGGGINIVDDVFLDNPVGSPATPTGLTATAKIAGIRLNWTANTEADLDRYIIYRNTSSPATTEYVRTDANAVLDQGVSYDVTYYYRLKAIDRAGNLSGFSAEVSAMPARASVDEVTDVTKSPPTFTAVAEEVDTTSTFRTWIKITITRVDGAGGYIVGYKKSTDATYNEGYVEQPATGNPVVVTPDLEANTLYNVRAATISKLGTASAWSSVQNVTTTVNNAAPPVPTGLASTATVNGVLLEWTDVVAGDFSHYKIYAGTTSPPTTLVGEVKSRLTLWKMKPTDTYVLYYFAISSVDTAGNESAKCTAVSATPIQVGTPDIAPNAITAEKILDGAVKEAKLDDLSVGTTKVKAAAITSRKMTVYSLFLEDITFTNNSPVAGSVAWSSGYLQYEGITYTIAAGNTALKYIYWDKPNVAFTASASKPTWQADRYIIGLNKAGVFYPVWRMTHIDGGTLITGTVTAQELVVDAAVITTSAQIGTGIILSDSLINLAAAKVLIDGAVYLSNWRKTGTLTKIDGGELYVGSLIEIASSGHIRSGQTAYDTGIGWWLGDVAGTPKFSIGNPAGNYLKWTGSVLSLRGSIIITSGSGIASLTDAGALATKSSVDLATGEVTNKILDNIADGTTYSKVLKTDISAGHILLSSVEQSVSYRTTSDAEKVTWNGKEIAVHRGTIAPTDTTKLWLDTSIVPNVWKQWSGTAWVKATPTVIDELGDGTYGKVLSTDISAGHILLSSVTQSASYRTTSDTEKGIWNGKPDDMDEIPAGSTYSKVLLTDLSAGHILLSSVVQSASYRTASDTEKGIWNSKPDNMDQIGEGTTYQKVRTTQIDAGYLKLTSATVKSGEWYDVSGVEIDATHGINLYGVDNALTTRATKAGTIQCKVDSSGRISAGAGTVLLDSAGIKIMGQYLKFHDTADTLCGHVYGLSGNIIINSQGNLFIYNQSGCMIWLKALSGTALNGPVVQFFPVNSDWSLLPTTSNFGYIGEPDRYWYKSYCNFVYYKVHDAFESVDDLALVKKVKPIKQTDKRGREVEVWNPKDLKFLMDPEDKEEFYNAGKSVGFLIGCVKKLVERIEQLEAR